jgi:hypothetical protein
VSQPGNPTIGNGASQRVVLARTAGFLHTLILTMRDSTGARIDGWGTRIRLYIDGVPIFDETLAERQNEMYRQAGGAITRPVGVLVYSWRESISQLNLGLADTNLRSLPVTPGTLIEIECTPWGTVTNAPAVLTAIFGTIIPRGSLVAGMPQEPPGRRAGSRRRSSPTSPRPRPAKHSRRSGTRRRSSRSAPPSGSSSSTPTSIPTERSTLVRTLTNPTFLTGVVAGVVLVWAYHNYVNPMPGPNKAARRKMGG